MTAPREEFAEIEACVLRIELLNRRLRAAGIRPINVCMTPSDVPPYTWLKGRKRKGAEQRFADMIGRGK